MSRRRWSILLVIVIAAQAALGNLSLCLDGGCCHTEVPTCESGHDHGDDHDHSALVRTDQLHPCDCTDLIVASIEIILGTRDEAALSISTFAVALWIATPDLVAPPHLSRPQPGRSRFEATDRQRSTVLRSTRLQL